jgi:hypothetical protein
VLNPLERSDALAVRVAAAGLSHTAAPTTVGAGGAPAPAADASAMGIGSASDAVPTVSLSCAVVCASTAASNVSRGRRPPEGLCNLPQKSL